MKRFDDQTRVALRVWLRNSVLSPCLGLEIGPLCNPQLKNHLPHLKSVEYLDFASRDHLRHLYKDDPAVDINSIPEINHIHASLSELCSSAAKKYGVIFSSHVLEHVPDMIGHLQSASKVLEDGGIYALTLPDHRYCFDWMKPPSLFTEYLAAYYNCQKRPPLEAILLDRSLNRPYGDKDIHLATDDERFLASLGLRASEIYSIFDRFKEGEYIDTHVWRFTPKILCMLIEKLNQLELLDLKVVFICEAVTDCCRKEFSVALQKTQISNL